MFLVSIASLNFSASSRSVDMFESRMLWVVGEELLYGLSPLLKAPSVFVYDK